ncbi:MAG: 6-pyruvoyl tetrahydropterin synthase [Verrucomicrobia bacterium]|nr:MAG: 6-pyruvoyl tetrahydropterin synthase [Verrucomicrobiota bacterium]
MPFRICKTIEIENGHMLSKHSDKCQFPHGHTRKVEHRPHASLENLLTVLGIGPATLTKIRTHSRLSNR